VKSARPEVAHRVNRSTATIRQMLKLKRLWLGHRQTTESDPNQTAALREVPILRNERRQNEIDKIIARQLGGSRCSLMAGGGVAVDEERGWIVLSLILANPAWRSRSRAISE